MSGLIYVLTNKAMPGLVKIGITSDNVGSRISSLNSATGVPLPFECFFAAEVEDSAKLEKTLHQLFSENRVNPKREFFSLEPERVVLAISIGGFKEVTPGIEFADKEEMEALEKANSRRPRIRLEALGIKLGDVLTFSRDESITASVASNNRVSYNGEMLSLSAAALKVLQSLGYQTSAASGSEYWMFEGELLDERRRKIEEKQFGGSDS